MTEKSSDWNYVSCFSILFWKILEDRAWVCGSQRRHSTCPPFQEKTRADGKLITGEHIVTSPPPNGTGVVFCCICGIWVLLNRQWTEKDTSGAHQSKGLVSGQGKGQETEIPNNIRYSTALGIVLLTMPFSHFDFQPHQTLLGFVP